MAAVPALVFAHSPGGFSEAGELLRALAFEAERLGASVERRESPLGHVGDGAIVVFSPRDEFAFPRDEAMPAGALRRAIAVCEGTPVGPLDAAYLHARRSAAALCVDPAGAGLLGRAGVPAEVIALGPSDAWRAAEPVGTRDIDVACLAERGFRNDRLVASFGPLLWRRRTHLLGPPDPTAGMPSPPPPPEIGFGAVRAALLARSTTLLLGLGQDDPWAERLRAIQAATNGAVIVAAHGTAEPAFRPGEDIAVAAPRNLAAVADGLLAEPERLRALSESAKGRAAAMPGMDVAAGTLLELAGKVAGSGPARRRTAVAAASQHRLSKARDALRERLQPPPNPARVEAKREAVAAIAAKRAPAGGADGADPGAPQILHTTPAYEGAQPAITVCVPLYEHEDAIERALESVAGAEGDYELLVVDDASTGPAPQVAVGFFERNPWIPARVYGRELNQGLGRGRTDLARVARGDLLFMLDADNEIYPSALTRLAGALEADPGAAFAYSVIEAHSEGRPRALLSALPWDPARLRRGNYIDAMSMIRRSALLDAGGYTDDVRLHGWEDFDLWCHFAERGLRGLLVPEILCRYTLSEGSMISITNVDSSEAWALLCEKYPRTLGGAPLPRYPSPPPDIEI